MMRIFHCFPIAFPRIIDLVHSLVIPFIPQILIIYESLGSRMWNSQNNLIEPEKSIYY